MRSLVVALLLAGTCFAPAVRAPFALLELFTSEGCSSCPPADRLLAEIAADARASRRPILTMEFHVDYWDRLGWTDPFSSRAFTLRQERYAKVLGLAQVYTPQLIVNGGQALVGSDRARAQSAIRSALARRAGGSLEFRVTPGADGYHVRYSISPALRGALVCFALVDSSRSSAVGAGENSGRTLAHTNVVRAFVSVPAGDPGAGVVVLPRAPGGGPPSQRVIGFVQDPRTLAVLAASDGRADSPDRP